MSAEFFGFKPSSSAFALAADFAFGGDIKPAFENVWISCAVGKIDIAVMHAVGLVAASRHYDISRHAERCPSRDRASPEIVRTEIIIGQLLCLHRCGNGSQPCFAHVADRLSIQPI